MLGSADALSLVLQIKSAVAVGVWIGDLAGEWHVRSGGVPGDLARFRKYLLADQSLVRLRRPSAALWASQLATRPLDPALHVVVEQLQIDLNELWRFEARGIHPGLWLLTCHPSWCVIRVSIRFSLRIYHWY